MNPIALNAILNSIRTTPDGGWCVTFDVPQSDVSQVMQLSAMREIALHLAVIPAELTQSPSPELTSEMIPIDAEPIDA